MSQRQLDIQDASDFSDVLSSRAGCRVMASILAMCKTMESSYYPGITDTLEVMFREGQRSIGLAIMSMCDSQETTKLQTAAAQRLEIFEREDDSEEKEGD